MHIQLTSSLYNLSNFLEKIKNISKEKNDE